MTPLPPPSKPQLLDQVREAIRTRHCSYRTEEAYVGWIRRYIFFHGKRHPAEMGKTEVATRSPLISWRPDTISGRSRNSSGMPTCARP